MAEFTNSIVFNQLQIHQRALNRCS